MKNIVKKSIIILLALTFVLAFVVPKSENSFAETPPYIDDYQQTKVWINGSLTNEVAFTIKGNVYIKVSTLQKYGETEKLEIDSKMNRIYFNVADLNISFGSAEATEFIKNNAGKCYIQIKTFKDENNKNDDFVSIGPIASLAKLIWTYQNESLYITQYSHTGNMAAAKLTSASAPSLYNKSIASLKTGEKVFIESETKAFYKVSTVNGNSYYVNKDELSIIDENTVINDIEYIPTTKDSFEGKINLTFLNLADNATRTPLPPDETGAVDVLSPTWLHQTVDADGAVKHICDYGYVQLAHDMGMKVWICANNCFTTTGSTNYTSKVMADEKLTDKVIAQYLFYACLYEADGINIDYEDLKKSDREIFTSFMTKVGKYCDLLGLTCSVDTSIPISYNVMYNWEELAKVCDYIIPMTYVEHMGTSVGSVSSYGWYSFYIDKLKTLVPAEKILMGVPFFSRYYYVDSAGKISSTSTMTMVNAKELVAENNSEIVWDDNDKQFVASYKNDSGKTFKMWLEDQHSLAVRLNYVLESGIAGTACWALEQTDSECLDIFRQVYKNGVDPSTYYYPTYYNQQVGE